MRYFSILILLLTTMAVTAQERFCDSSELVYIAASDEDYTDIFVANIDRLNEVNLTNDNLSEVEPRWSPDGTQIVFTTSTGLDEEDTLTIINADGSNRQVLYSGGFISFPQWSPNGNYITDILTDFNGYGAIVVTSQSIG